MWDDRDRLITALVRKLGGQATISDKELIEADECLLIASPDTFSYGTHYTVTHPATEGKRRMAPVEPNLLIAALMDYARERDLTFGREYLQVHMARYKIEVTDDRERMATRIRMWADDELPPSRVNPPPAPAPTVKAEAVRLPLLEIE